MKSAYIGIPLLLASSLLFSACTGGQENTDNISTPNASESVSIDNSKPKETKSVDPNDPNQGRNLDPVPESTFTAPAGSPYDMAEKGKGVDKSKDAGNASTASELNAPIKSGGLGTQAGVAVIYTGKGFPASTPVSIKILTVDGVDTGISVENSTADGEGNVSARVYFPKNLQAGTYEVVFNAGGTEQKTKIDLITGLN